MRAAAGSRVRLISSTTPSVLGTWHPEGLPIFSLQGQRWSFIYMLRLVLLCSFFLFITLRHSLGFFHRTTQTFGSLQYLDRFEFMFEYFFRGDSNFLSQSLLPARNLSQSTLLSTSRALDIWIRTTFLIILIFCTLTILCCKTELFTAGCKNKMCTIITLLYRLLIFNMY